MNKTYTALVLAAAAGASVLIAGSAGADSTCTVHTAAFGWEANNLHNHGANLVLPVTQAMHVTSVTIDYAMARTPGKVDGWREALGYIAVNPTGSTGAPTFQPTAEGAPGWGASSRTGAESHGGGMTDRLFAQVILKNSYSGEIVTQALDYTLAKGDRVVVHADAYGATTDVEAQGSLTYCVI